MVRDRFPPGLVLVITTAAIASFAVPQTEGITSFRLIRVLLLLFALVLGFMGLVVGFVLVVYHLASLKSLRVPYLSLIYRSELPAPSALYPSAQPW